jgi:hypothetical protein
MPPQRKKAKTTAYSETSLAAQQQQQQQQQHDMPDPALHPDLAAQSTPTIKMDPGVLHPDLAAASAAATTSQSGQFPLEGAIIPSTTASPTKHRKNAAAASKAAAAAAAILKQQQHLQQQQQQQQQQQEGQQQGEQQGEDVGLQGDKEPEEAAVSVDAAAEFLRTIQEREQQKNLLALTGQSSDAVVLSDQALAESFGIPLQMHQGGQSFQGFPTLAQFNAMVDDYLGSLSIKKQAKALLTQQMYDDILNVLIDPTGTKVGTAQFRFWAKKMFKVVTTQVAHIVIHENKPVAVKEQLYEVLVQCHGQANHGGRDKTAAQVQFLCLYRLTTGSQVLFVGAKGAYCEIRQRLSKLCAQH